MENRTSVLFTAVMSTMLSFSTACGGGGAPTGAESEAEAEAESDSGATGEGEAEAEAEGGESEAEGQEAEAESEADGGCTPMDCDDGRACTDDAWDAVSCACVHTPHVANCDDGVDCTDDRVDTDTCACVHDLDHAFCFLQDAGTICDASADCITPQVICNGNADCPNLDGGCILGSCDLSVASCVYEQRDLDHDGHAVQTCDSIGGDDCNDTNAAIHPGATELCDDIDNNCDSVTDLMSEPCGTDTGECSTGTRTCTAGDWSWCSGGVPRGEWCDGLDNDCDWTTDEGCDDDDDGWCDGAMVRVVGAAVCPLGGQDCDDERSVIHPTAPEICDDLDNNCSRSVDEGCDNDNDGFCDNDMVMGPFGAETCRWTPVGATYGNDCNDADTTIHPCLNFDTQVDCISACFDEGDNVGGCVEDCRFFSCSEPCDGVDNDCDDLVDEGVSNACGLCGPVPDEVCNGLDDNCDGRIDEGCNGDPTPSYDASNGGVPDAGVDSSTEPDAGVPACVGGCDDNDACTTDTCDATGSCVHSTVGIDDANVCTLDSCVAAVGVSHDGPDDITSQIDGDPVIGNTDGATDLVDGSCAAFGSNPGREVIFAVTPIQNMTLVLSTFGSAFDTVLSVRTNCPNASSEISCNDDAVGVTSLLTVSVNAGATHYIIVEGWSADDHGAFRLALSRSRCGDALCLGDESDASCAVDCGCAARASCTGSAPAGCFCDTRCVTTRDCCADACAQCGACGP